MEEEAARSGPGVDGVGETAGADTLFMEVPNQIDEVLDVTALPKRRMASANSRPTYPPPRMIKWSGTVSNSSSST